MNTFLTQPKILLKKYHDFDDGLVTLFEYRNSFDRPPSAKVVLYARNHESSDNEWNYVEISMSNVLELCVSVSQKQFIPILLGVRILDFVDVLCVDVDGNYASTLGPSSLTEIRRLGDFYFIGKEVSTNEIIQSDVIANDIHEEPEKGSIEENKNISFDCANFVGEKLVSFSCHQDTDELLSVKIVVEGKKLNLDQEVEASIEIIVNEAHDGHIKFREIHFASVTSRVRLFQFGDLYCVDIGGSYADSDLPQTFDEVKRSGNCYALGGSVKIRQRLL